jgi:hypothetical protein
MKKSRIYAAATAALLSLGITGASVATATAASAQTSVSPVIYGSQWTVYDYSNGACENIIFYAGTFIADQFRDAGRFTGGGSTIQMRWTRGLDRGTTFAGVYSRAGRGYYGFFNHSSVQASVTKGWTVGC